MMQVLQTIVFSMTLGLQPDVGPRPESSATAPSRVPKDVAPPDSDQSSPVIDRFKSRLEALTPGKPEAYFLLGEEVADQAADVRTRRLATQLFVLAFDLSRDRPVQGGAGSLQAGCCLALSDLVKAERDRRWLVALARTLDPRRVPPEWLARQNPPTADSAAYQVAEVMGLVRSGDGGQARQRLERPEVKAALQSYDRMMENMGMSGGAGGIVREAERWPCRECNNERVVKRGTEVRICPNCNGDPGPELSGKEFMAQLRFESIILQGAQRSWAAQVVADGGTPLMDPDAGGLPAAFDVDPSLVLWRKGEWVADPNAPARPKPPPPPLPKPKPPAEGPVTTTPSTGG